MSVAIRMVRAAAITSGGPTQDLTIPGWGFTPKAALIIATGATTNAVQANDARLSCALIDGTRTTSISELSRHNVSPTNCRRRSSATKAIALMTDELTMDAEATASLIPNGVRLTWTDFPSTAVLITCYLFGGDTDLSAAVGEFIASSIVDTATNVVVAAPTFQPDIVIVISGGIGEAANRDFTFFFLNTRIGFARRTGASPFPQAFSKWSSSNGVAASNDVNYVSSASVSGDGSSQAIEITAFNVDGFTVTTRGSGFLGRYGYLALAFNGTANHWIGVVNSPTIVSPPNYSNSQPGFKPQFVLQLTPAVTLVNTVVTQSSTGAGSFGIVGITATEMFSNTVSSDDATQVISPAVAAATESFASDDFRCRFDSANAVDPLDGSPKPPAQPNVHVGTFPTPQSDIFHSMGWALPYSVVDIVTVRKWPTLVIGEFVPAGGTATPVYQNSYRQRRV